MTKTSSSTARAFPTAILLLATAAAAGLHGQGTTRNANFPKNCTEAQIKFAAVEIQGGARALTAAQLTAIWGWPSRIVHGTYEDFHHYELPGCFVYFTVSRENRVVDKKMGQAHSGAAASSVPPPPPEPKRKYLRGTLPQIFG
jgi:hypothetical protein